MKQTHSERNFLVISLTILALAAPAALSMGYFLFSGDPRVRPLALTREGEAVGQGDAYGIEILATLHWGRDGTFAFTPENIRQRIQDAFYSHGEEVRIVTQEVSGQYVQISYKIGQTQIGPMDIDAAAMGIRAAIDAYRIATR